MRLGRKTIVQLAVFAAIAVIAIGIAVVSYMQIPTVFLGVGRHRRRHCLPGSCRRAGWHSFGGSEGGDVASASGAGSTADAALGMDSAKASDGGTADSGLYYDSSVPETDGGGIGDSATATGAGSTAAAGFGNYDSADVFGTDSTALAEGITSTTDTTGNYDIADAFGNDITANATGGSFLLTTARWRSASPQPAPQQPRRLTPSGSVHWDWKA